MSTGYDAKITRIGAMALFDLKGKEKAVKAWCKGLPAFPKSANSFSEKEGVRLLYIGRDHWLVLADLALEDQLSDTLRPALAPLDVSVVRVSDTQCFFSVTGVDAAQIMAIASPLDLHPSTFPTNGATFSEVFSLKALILPTPGGFLFSVEQSFGDMVEDYLARAMA